MITGGVSVYLYKDRIIQQFIRNLNEQLNSPVHVDRFDANIFDNFPYVSITLNNVMIEESYSWSTDTLLSAKKITLSLNPIDLIQDIYVVHNVRIDLAAANFKINRKGEANYAIFKRTNSKKEPVFDINGIKLNYVDFHYHNLASDKSVDLYAEHLSSSLHSYGKIIEIQAKGDVTSYSIGINNNIYLENTEFTTDSHVIYNLVSKKVDIQPSVLVSNNSEFIVKGSYSLPTGEMSLSIDNDKTTVQTLLALIPPKYTVNLDRYESTGDGYLKLTLRGVSNGDQYPAVNIDFGLSNSSIYHPDYDTRLEAVTLNGTYQSSSINDISTANLRLKDVIAVLDGKQIQGNLELNNLVSSYIKADFSGEIELKSLLNFYPSHEIDSVSGSVIANVSINGKVSDLKTRATINKVKTTGEIDLKGVSFKIKNLKLPYSKLNGKLLFNNNDLAINGLSGNHGNSDFLIDGFFKNFVSYILLDDQPIGIEANLQTNLLDLDELLSDGPGFKENPEGSYTFSISPNLHLKFNCSIEQLKFRRFLGNSISGELIVTNQLASSNNISISTMGGNVKLSGSVDASSPIIQVFTNANLDEIAIDQVFYVFENFNQEFLVDKNLKGNVNAQVVASMKFDENLTIDPLSLTSDITATINKGELNNFEPMQRLSKYLDEHELSALRFSELKNEIHIENKTIYLPEMEVRSNASNITIGGTHTFSQKINYSVVAPLNNKKKKDSDEVFGAIEQDKSGQAKVFLKIIGTTSDYEVSYDKRAVKKEIISDLKREVQELKEAFKTKGKEAKKEVELEDDDYFDWD